LWDASGVSQVISLIKGENNMTTVGRITPLDSNFSVRDLNRFSVGFDRIFDDLSRQVGISKSAETAYPPYNIVKHSDTNYSIEVAVAGFGIEDIEVHAHERELVVRGNRGQEETREFLHRGIGLRNFERKFTLADHMQVRSAEIVNGLLILNLELEIPESQRPRQIPVTFKQ
jgi:molecular chaperone IbpA